MRKNTPVERNNIYTVTIENVSSDGNGIGHINGFTVFVPATAAGDVVRAKIIKIKSGYCYAQVSAFLEYSPDRCTPPCPYFAECGGCSLMHISYDKQLAIKSGTIINALKRIGGFAEVPYEGIIPSPKPLGYRNKMIFSAAQDDKFGLYREGTRSAVPIDGCMLADPIASEIIAAVSEYMSRSGASVYDEKSHTGLIRRLFLRVSHTTGEIMAVISANGAAIPKENLLVERIRAVSDKIVSIMLNINQKKTSNILGERNVLLYGKATISDSLLGINYEISPESFFQVNPEAAELLYKKALEYAAITPETRVLDIYCGIGTITLSAAKYAKSATGIEIVERAVENAKESAAANGVENVKFYAGDAAELTAKLTKDAEFDTVILDPPRKGCDERTLRAVAAASPERIVYVSCNPATLARDARTLAEQGYSLAAVTGVDMFAQTNHVETVVLLSKGEIDSKKVRVEFSLEDMDMSGFRNDATYAQIKERVLEQTGLKVSSLYIAQIKQKYGIIERENYNKPKSEDARQPQCPIEKEKAITEALRYFGMI